MRHFPPDILEGLFHHLASVLPGETPSVEIQAHKLGIVIKHFFEMRDLPFDADGIAVKSLRRDHRYRLPPWSAAVAFSRSEDGLLTDSRNITFNGGTVGNF
jgi:hypothetical protein